MSALPLSEMLLTEPLLAADEPGWLTDYRQKAYARLQQTGLPAEGSENWRYSSLRSLLGKNLTSQAEVLLEPEEFLIRAGIAQSDFRLVFVNGFYQAHLSLVPANLNISNFTNAATDYQLKKFFLDMSEASDAGFSHLNNATFQDGLYIRLEKDVVCPQPIHLIQVCSGGMLSNARHVVDLGESSSLTLIEQFIEISPQAVDCLLNTQIHVALADDARLDWIRTQTLGSKSILIDRVQADLSAGSHLHCTHLDLGGHWVRHDFDVSLQAADSFIEVDGLVLVRGRQHTDFHTRIDHQAVNCTSRENFKCIADGRGRGVYNGKILVQPGADGTDSAQKSSNLLLSKHAEIDTKPDLEILADDVIASHGATVGQLDEDALFYMQTRGIDAKLGRKMLLRAFCQEVIDLAPIESTREALGAKLDLVFDEMELGQ